MTLDFERKVYWRETVDTKKYRYHIKWGGAGYKIIRIPLSLLDTTAALYTSFPNGWEVVRARDQNGKKIK